MAKRTAATPATTGNNILASHVNNVSNDVREVYPLTIGDGCPFTPAANEPVIMRLWMKSAAFAVGGTNSDGVFRYWNEAPWDSSIIVEDQSRFLDTCSSTTPNTLITNRLFLLPAHSALTITKLSGRLQFGGYGAAVNLVIDKFEILTVKVSTGGAETTLDTTTVSTSLPTFGATGHFVGRAFAEDFGAGYALTTERLGVRVKIYGHLSSAGGGYVIPNADGWQLSNGTVGNPDAYGYRPSLFAFTLSA